MKRLTVEERMDALESMIGKLLEFNSDKGIRIAILESRIQKIEKSLSKIADEEPMQGAGD